MVYEVTEIVVDLGPLKYIPVMGRLYQRLDMVDYRPYSLSEYAARGLWELVRTVVIPLTPRRAFGFRRGVLRAFGGQIGAGVKIRKSAKIHHPWLLCIGEHSEVGDEVEIYNLGLISIGSHTVISQRAYLCAGTHDYSSIRRPLQRSKIEIGSGVWICAAAFIGPGVCVGDNAIVGAASVVTRNVDPTTVVAGNPAKKIKDRQPPVDLV